MKIGQLIFYIIGIIVIISGLIFTTVFMVTAIFISQYSMVPELSVAIICQFLILHKVITNFVNLNSCFFYSGCSTKRVSSILIFLLIFNFIWIIIMMVSIVLLIMNVLNYGITDPVYILAIGYFIICVIFILYKSICKEILCIKKIIHNC